MIQTELPDDRVRRVHWKRNIVYERRHDLLHAHDRLPFDIIAVEPGARTVTPCAEASEGGDEAVV